MSFVDGIGGTLLFPFFALYITQKFNVGMTQAGILLGMSSLVRFDREHVRRRVDRQIRAQAVDPVRSDLQRRQHAWIRFRQRFPLLFPLVIVVGLLSNVSHLHIKP